MTTRRQIADEGALTSWGYSGAGMATGMMVCPMLVAQGVPSAAAVEEIYRLAYEWARLATRPSAYEMALRASCN